MNPQLVVYIPRDRIAEHTWIAKTLLTTYLGLTIDISVHEHRSIVITEDLEESRLELPSILLSTGENDWNTSTAVPNTVPLWIDQSKLPWNVPEPHVSLPILYCDGDPHGPSVEVDHVTIPWDLFGSAFFMLTRLEEVLLDDVDAHGRFPAAASLAVKSGFERIPVVNAWAEILWGAIHHLWPNFERKQHTYRVLLSHDVDWPLVSHKMPLLHILRRVAGDLVLRKSPSVAVRRFISHFAPESLKPLVNPGNTFDFIMRESERHNLSSAFYFIPENTAGTMDGTYTLEMPFIENLLREIHTRNHEIGIHPGFETFRSPEAVDSGFQALRSAACRLGINQNTWGGRQHILRWSAAETWRHWESAGLDYDSTVGFAESVGFRTGACFDYPVFDVIDRQELALIERPLIVMESSLFAAIASNHMAMSDEEGTAIISNLAKTVHLYGGNFTLLWHNSSLITPRQRRLYKEVLTEISC